jgi:hypothetical protein
MGEKRRKEDGQKESERARERERDLRHQAKKIWEFACHDHAEPGAAPKRGREGAGGNVTVLKTSSLASRR